MPDQLLATDRHLATAPGSRTLLTRAGGASCCCGGGSGPDCVCANRPGCCAHTTPNAITSAHCSGGAGALVRADLRCCCGPAPGQRLRLFAREIKIYHDPRYSVIVTTATSEGVPSPGVGACGVTFTAHVEKTQDGVSLPGYPFDAEYPIGCGVPYGTAFLYLLTGGLWAFPNPDGTCACIPGSGGSNGLCRYAMQYRVSCTEEAMALVFIGNDDHPGNVDTEDTYRVFRLQRDLGNAGCVEGATGGCCLPDGTCIDCTTAASCAAAGGTFLGVGEVCYDHKCRARGRCCVEGACMDGLLETDCDSLGGVWGTGTCAGHECQWACCEPGGECTETTESECAGSGGLWHLGQSCQEVVCAGACCVSTTIPSTCGQTTAAGCAAIGGVWHSGMSCQEACPPGVCCLKGECSATHNMDDCLLANGQWFQNMGCDEAPCGCSVNACCYIAYDSHGNPHPVCANGLSQGECDTFKGTYYPQASCGNDPGCASINCIGAGAPPIRGGNRIIYPGGKVATVSRRGSAARGPDLLSTRIGIGGLL